MKSPEASQTTSNSTTSSSWMKTKYTATLVEWVQEQKFNRKKWEYHELKKALLPSVQKKVTDVYMILTGLRRSTRTEQNKAVKFLQKTFPGRSPWSVYLKVRLLKRNGKKKIILI